MLRLTLVMWSFLVTTFAMDFDGMRSLKKRYEEGEDVGKQLLVALNSFEGDELPADLDKVLEELMVIFEDEEGSGDEMDYDEDMGSGYGGSPMAAVAASGMERVERFGPVKRQLVHGDDFHLPARYDGNTFDGRLPPEYQMQLDLIRRDVEPLRMLNHRLQEASIHEAAGLEADLPRGPATDILDGRYLAVMTGAAMDDWPKPESVAKDKLPASTTCSICLRDKPLTETFACGEKMHCDTMCRDCLKDYIQMKINDGDVMPWICCPGVQQGRLGPKKCKSLLPLPMVKELLGEMDPKATYNLAQSLLRKNLVRDDCWVECQNGRCKDGFICLGPREDKMSKEAAATGGHFGRKDLSCQICERTQCVTKMPDPEQVDLLHAKHDKEGSWALSACCEIPTWKEYGVCNIIQCQKCGLTWNFSDPVKGGAVAYDSDAMKQQARGHSPGTKGALWQSSAEQGHIDTLSKAEQKKLIERNGGTYIEGYSRGS